jgi:replication factor A1
VLFHYALVDDLISKEEFEKRVEDKINEFGDLIDEPTAAMIVVGGLGRAHVKISGLSAKSSLFSFFGKVMDKTEPKEFTRNDGEQGWVATILLGDETGTTRVVLWDEKAGAVLDINAGEVLEIIGRHPGRNTKEIYALALRKAGCEIVCADPAKGVGLLTLSTEPVDLTAVIIAIEEPRTYTKRDGSTGTMQGLLVGDGEGAARIISWSPEILEGLVPGSVVRINGAKPGNRGEGREYNIDEKCTVVPVDTAIEVPSTPLASVSDKGTYSVTGRVREAREPRSFTTRDGATSWVRNVVIADETEELRVVLWGEKALIPIHAGDEIRIYHATAQAGKFGGIEIAAGRGSAVIVPAAAARPITFTGTIIARNGSTFIDDGKDGYLIEGSIPHGTEVGVSGILAGSRIIPDEIVPADITHEMLMAKLRQLREELGPSQNTV